MAMGRPGGSIILPVMVVSMIMEITIGDGDIGNMGGQAVVSERQNARKHHRHDDEANAFQQDQFHHLVAIDTHR